MTRKLQHQHCGKHSTSLCCYEGRYVRVHAERTLAMHKELVAMTALPICSVISVLWTKRIARFD